MAWRGVAWRGVACGMSSSNVTSGALKLATWRQKRLDDTSHNGKKQAYLVASSKTGWVEQQRLMEEQQRELEQENGGKVPA